MINKIKEDLKKGCVCPFCNKNISLRKTPGETAWNIMQHLRKHKLISIKKAEQIFLEMLEDWVENKLFKKIDTNGTGVKWFKIHNWKVEFLNELKSKINSSQRNERLGDDEELSFKKQSPANKEPEEDSPKINRRVKTSGSAHQKEKKDE